MVRGVCLACTMFQVLSLTLQDLPEPPSTTGCGTVGFQYLSPSSGLSHMTLLGHSMNLYSPIDHISLKMALGPS